VTSPLSDAEALARVLRQRREFGATEWIVETGSARESVQAAQRLRESGRRLRSIQPVLPVEEGPGISRSEGSVVPIRSDIHDAIEPDFEVGYDELRELALGCTRCRLCEGRTQVVFSDGNSRGRLMVVGEAPGANEDRTGLPFVGAAGKLLDLLLASINLSRKTSVYICNVIKCRPPGNRNPSTDEISACAPYLRRQIEFVRPAAILAVGSFAAQLLSGKDNTIGELRGVVHEYQGIPLVVTYHPAALLRNPGWTRPSWEDLQILRDLLDSRAGSHPS